MKKIIIILLFTLVLSSCFWSSDSAQSGLVLQDREDFSILVPETWASVDDLPVPKSWEIVLAHSSANERQWYLNNIVVLASPSSTETSLSIMNNIKSTLESRIEGFTPIDEKQVTFADEETSLLLTYTGKYNSDTPNVVYIQTARVCGETKYFLTLSLAERLEDYSRYEYIMQTFRCN